jgi:hypothetical protein
MKKANGAEFHSLYPTTESCRRNREAFVDDTTLWTVRLGQFFLTLVDMMCKTAQRWERLLCAAGGALNLMKCFWYGVQWSFMPSGVPYMEKTKDVDPDIALSSGADFDTTYNIQRIETTKGMRTLGV